MLSNSIMYAGALIFIAHMIKHRLKLQRSTYKFIITPYVLSLGSKWLGYLWVDRTVENVGLYDEYWFKWYFSHDFEGSISYCIQIQNQNIEHYFSYYFFLCSLFFFFFTWVDFSSSPFYDFFYVISAYNDATIPSILGFRISS